MFYHVSIDRKSDSDTEFEMDIDEKKAMKDFIEPYIAGTAIFINGRRILVDDIKDLKVCTTDVDAKQMAENVRHKLENRPNSWYGMVAYRHDNFFVMANGKDVKKELIAKQRAKPKTDLKSLKDIAVTKMNIKSIKKSIGKKEGIIFISCGQYSNDEKALGKKLVELVDKKTPYKGYFAEKHNSLKGLTNSIFNKLNDCVGFVAVMHKRGFVKTRGKKTLTRASVWIEQEIAIASFIQDIGKKDLKVVSYVEKGVNLEGVRKYIQLNPIQFTKNSEVIKDFDTKLSGGLSDKKRSRKRGTTKKGKHNKSHTLSIVPMNKEMFYSNSEGVGNKSTQLHGVFTVTNVDPQKRTVAIVKGEIVKPYHEFAVSTYPPPGSARVSISSNIPFGGLRELIFDTFVEPRIVGTNRHLKLKIVLIDQYGNKFKNDCVFKYLESGVN